jgi:hypothetical protein
LLPDLNRTRLDLTELKASQDKSQDRLGRAVEKVAQLTPGIHGAVTDSIQLDA